MFNSMLKIFVGPVMGGGLNPHQPPVNTPLVDHYASSAIAEEIRDSLFLLFVVCA
jgi:hypothetical protein